ncbi:MAG: ribonuclease HI [Firmicutes bacterium]|nr:ribonuclease HI [Bacillota bacterium]NLL87684.1 ribonuclease HI [Bacillota bacterium]HKM16687.1 ribonuclease HI [Limnochordia bacterium]
MLVRQLVEIYTDGACSRNPGPGGWAAILIYNDRFRQHVKEYSGHAEHTTNQRMELTAAIEGLKRLKTSCRVKLYSDSAYLVNAFARDWFAGWKRRDWKNARNQPVSNQDLWEQLLELAKKHDIEWIKVEGHADNDWNNRCDQLAREAIKQGSAGKKP